MATERRRSPRYRPHTEVYGRLKSVLPARILDISLHGAQVEVSQSLQRRAEVRFSLPTPEGDLLLHALVRRCSLTGLRKAEHAEGESVTVYRAGLEFVNLSQEQNEALKRYWSGLQEDAELELRISA
jgi:c-di-GMP-binding flagellar brake protein YcgR